MTNEKLKVCDKAEDINYNETTFLTPMGACENLVGIMPVVLSEFESKIFCEFSYKAPIICLETLKNKVLIQKCKILDKNSKLLIQGCIKKDILVKFDLCAKRPDKETTITIPFKTIVDLEYYVNPANDTSFKTISPSLCSKKTLFSPSEKLFWLHNYSKMSEHTKVIPIKNCNNTTLEYVTTITLSLGISIIQNRRIFLIEPEGTATVIAEAKNSLNCIKNDKIIDFEVGFDKENGLLARVIKD